jgi:hypothetical protein
MSIGRLLFTNAFLSFVAMALPPSSAQCGGYAYSHNFQIYRSGNDIHADAFIGTVNPCGFRIEAKLQSPSGRQALSQDGLDFTFVPSSASAPVSLTVGTDLGDYKATFRWQVEDERYYPFTYYPFSPGTAIGSRVACSNSGDDREDIIPQYFVYGASWTPSCSDFTQQSTSQYFTFSELNGGDFNWAILRASLLSGIDSTRINYGAALSVSSGYRNPSRNFAIGGATNSPHIYGEAIDLHSNAGTWSLIRNAGLDAGACGEPYDRTYPSWVHLDWFGSCPPGWRDRQ